MDRHKEELFHVVYPKLFVFKNHGQNILETKGEGPSGLSTALGMERL